MEDRRVWRASPATLALVPVFMLVPAVAVPLLAHLTWADQGARCTPAPPRRER